jgi:LEA14-like dessication related protein
MTYPNKMRKGFILAFLGFLLSAVTNAAPQQKLDVEITVVEKRIADPTTQGLNLVFILNVKNLLTIPQMLSRYDYKAVVDGVGYLDIQTELDAPIRIEGREEARIALPIRITYEYLYVAVPSVQGRDQAACALAGGLTFRDDRGREKRAPFSFAGEFPVFRGLEVGLLPIEARDLTVGGADLVFKAVVKNPNGFPFTIERLSYKLELVGIPVREGVAGRGAAVDARGETAVAVPLLLDFFELGRGLYDGLSQPPTAARLAGEVVIRSVWGAFTLPFDRSDKVAVTKLEGARSAGAAGAATRLRTSS